MRQWLTALARKLVFGRERIALRALLTELQISHHHRKGMRAVRRQNLRRPLKLNLGSGNIFKRGYLNVDLFPGGDLTLDLRRELPFDSNCCETIFSEHFFEHIEYPAPISFLLRDCLRVLQPGGPLRLSVPDTEWPLFDYPHGLQIVLF